MRSDEAIIMTRILRKLYNKVEDAQKVKFYRYRSAILIDCFMEFRDYYEEEKKIVMELENLLYKKAGIKNKDNHVLFQSTLAGGKELCIKISDWTMRVGLAILYINRHNIDVDYIWINYNMLKIIFHKNS